jgi:hypothetical protein
MNFRNTTLTFTLDYCKRNCLVLGLSNAALMIQAPIKDFHDLPVSDEPLTTTFATILETKYSKSVYRKCTAEDENKQAPPEPRNKRLIYPDNPLPRNQPFLYPPNKWQPQLTSHNDRNQPCKSTSSNLYIGKPTPPRKTSSKGTIPFCGTASGKL